MCLSCRISDKIPNSTQKQVLEQAELGLKNIVFDLKDVEEEVYAKLTFSELNEEQNTIGSPQLKNCDGFELLQCVPNCRVLESIECAVDKTLKTSACQGKIYKRPIQISLLAISIRLEV